MDERECQRQAVRIEALLRDVAALSDERLRARVEDLVHGLLEVYGAGLARMVEMVAQSELTGQELLQTFAGDELVSSLLLLHGLHPVGLEERLHRALEKLRSGAQMQGGTLELVRVADSVAELRFSVQRQGCGASVQGLKQSIEQAIYDAAPELDEVRIEEIALPQCVSIPVRFVSPRKRQEQSDAQPQSRAGVSGTR